MRIGKGDEFMKNSDKVIKVLGVVSTVMGVAATLMSSYASDKNMERTIEEKVNEAIKNINK